MDSIQHERVAVLFDLDNTLFDHHHSLRSAISSIQASYDSLKTHNVRDLVSTYNNSLDKAYGEYLRNEISYEETEFKKVRLFFNEIGLPEPDHEQIIQFRNIYKPVYRDNRRATPDSVEMLIRLRENGFQLGIVANGQLKDQLEKAEAIRVHHHVDTIITSEEAGCCKPDTKIFRLAIERLGASSQKSYMIGDSVESDIKGGLESGLGAILYS
ncbi:HAD-like protein, partial [Colletotrichum zoysiae]